MFGMPFNLPNAAQESTGFQNYGNPLEGTGLSQTQINDLIKALSAGYDNPPTTGGGALRPESLDASLKVLEFREGHLKMWKQIDKTPAASTVEQYNVLTSYGPSASLAVRFGETPPMTDSEFVRRVLLLKAFGVTRQVTDEMTLVNSQPGSVISLYTRNAILELLRFLEYELFEGDSTLAFNGESEQFNGLNAQIQGDMTVDMEGSSLSEAAIETVANMLVEHYANPNKLFLNTQSASDLNKTMYPRERYNLPAPTDGVIGINVNQLVTSAGHIDLEPDIFLRPAPSPNAIATAINAPVTPASVAVTGVAGTDADWAKLLGTPTANTLFAYAVCAGNRHGLSAPVLIAVPQALTPANVAAGAHITLTVTNAAVIGANPPEFFVVYRSNPLAVGATTPLTMDSYSEIGRFAAISQTASAATNIWNDVNLYLPFTYRAYMGELTPAILTLRQLAPMRKINLAMTSPAYTWMILIYCAMALFAPAKWARIINIGKLT